jgi:uncharacterized protein
LDEVAITAIRDHLLQLEELENRQGAILKSLTDELRDKIIASETMTALEDIYLPFRPKRRTRATIAREKGPAPPAKRLFVQEAMDLAAEAAPYIDAEKGVATQEDALAGARDIIAEWVNEDQEARGNIRTLFSQKGVIRSRVIPEKEAETIKYRDYYDWEEAVAAVPSHRSPRHTPGRTGRNAHAPYRSARGKSLGYSHKYVCQGDDGSIRTGSPGRPGRL